MFRCAVIFCLIATQTAHALRCHVCKNMQKAECLYVTTAEDDRFLMECPPETTACGLTVPNAVGKITYLYCCSSLAPPCFGAYSKVIRECMSKSSPCKDDCQTCITDGCNYGSEIKTSTETTHLSASPTELVMANIYAFGAIVLVAGLFLIWCVSRACSRNNDEYDEDEEDDYEYDECNEKSF